MLAIILSFLLLAAEVPPTASLSSSHAAYDGNALVLTGHVVLDHGLGKMHAEHASLQKQEMGIDFPFTVIELQKDVVLNLKNNATLSCFAANLDFTLLKGFLSSQESTRVVFSDLIKKKTPLTLTSNQAEITFSKSLDQAKKSDYDVETILALEEVVLEYNTSFVLYADKALYRKILPQDNKTAPKEFQGFISAYPKEDNSFCRLTHEGDQIEASAMDVDLLHNKISMLHPHGSFVSSLFPHVKGNKLLFQSEHLLWDQNRETILLTGKAQVNEENVGSLNAEEELRLRFAKRDEKNFLKSISTKGKAVLTYGLHQFTCHGPIHLDRDLLHVQLDSPSMGGVVPNEKQIAYQEGGVKIYSDKAFIEYSFFDEKIHPVSVTLKENVRLFSKNENKHCRFALADRLTYSPATRTFILTATPGKKVLFRDDKDSLSVSAQEVHITYNPETKEEKIQGVGNVKLSFNSEEINLLKKMFPSYE